MGEREENADHMDLEVCEMCVFSHDCLMKAEEERSRMNEGVQAENLHMTYLFS